MKSVIIIDVAGAFYQFWHATASEPLNEAYQRTIDKVHYLARDYDYAIVTVDAPPYKRKLISPEYKAQRDKPEDVLIEQYRKTKLRLAADGFPVLSASGYESDDIIAAIVHKIRGKYIISVASSDKDLTALADDENHISVVSIGTGKVFDEAAVREKFGVNPADIRDWLSLVGDKSDGIKGIDGVGPVAASKIINSPEGLQGLFAGIDVEGVTPRIHKLIRDGEAQVRLAQKLVTLMVDAPVDLTGVFETRKAQPITKSVNPFEEKEEMPEKTQDAEFSDESVATLFGSESPTAAQFLTEKVSVPISPAASHSVPDLQVTQPRHPAPIVLAQSAAATVKPTEWALALEPTSTAEAYKMACKINNSRLFGNFANEDAIFAILLRGRSLGIDAVTSLSNFHVIENKVTLSASLIVGLVLRSGKAEYFDLVETTNEKATWVTRRKGSTREVTLSWTTDDAAAAGFLVRQADGSYVGKKPGSNWDKYRRTMLRWRASTELARAVFADVISGLYTPDEISDGEHEASVDVKYELVQ